MVPLLKRLLICAVVAPLAGLASGAVAQDYAAIVVDAQTGAVLESRSALASWYPASLTKVMTVYLTLQAVEAGELKLDEELTVSTNAASQPPTELGLGAGDKITVEQAILAVILQSANDVAVVLAERIAGTEEAFAEKMTTQAHALGMARTEFRNATGLPDPDQVPTARDMA